jgi:ferredoxin
MKKEKYLLPLVFSLMLFVMLSGCGENIDDVVATQMKNEEKNVLSSNTQNVDSTNNVNQNNKNEVVNDEIANTKVLSVDGNKCIGCGKCARTAASNFEMEKGKAVVISQENIDSSNVTKAVRGCPGQAINIS